MEPRGCNRWQTLANRTGAMTTTWRHRSATSFTVTSRGTRGRAYIERLVLADYAIADLTTHSR
jgi:hypothetical protein